MEPGGALGAAILLATAAGCGSGGDEAAGAADAIRSAKEVRHCMVAAGGIPNGLRPIKPKGFPAGVEAAMVRGVDGDDIGIYLSRKPVFTDQVAAAFAEIGEFHAQVLAGGRALLLYLPGYVTQNERDAAVGCLSG